MSEPGGSAPEEPRQDQDVEPTCPRHPGVVAYVRCQRCRRPVCPQCQRPAAVGIQCVDCVKEGARSVRSGTTVFGGAVTDGRPLVTWALIGACIAVFAGQLVLPAVSRYAVFVPELGTSQPWRFLTSAFAHSPSNYFHILFNMWCLWQVGPYLEGLLGRARFLGLYLLSALGGSVGYLLLATEDDWRTGVVGASGAVFGLFGAFVVLQRTLGRSAAGMYAAIAINAVIGFVYPNIAWQGHLGGLVTGVVAAAIIARTGRRPQPGQAAGSWAAHWVGLGVVLVVLVVLAAAKYALTGS